MRPDAVREFDKAMIQFGDVYGRPIKGQLLEWYKLAGDLYAAAVIKGAAARWIMTDTTNKAPGPGRFRELCKEIQADQRLEEPVRALPAPRPTAESERFAQMCLSHMKELAIGQGPSGGWAPGRHEAWLLELSRACPIVFAEVYPEGIEGASARDQADRAKRALI